MEGDRTSKKREGPGTESSDRPAKVHKCLIIEGEHSAFGFKVTKRTTDFIEGFGGTTDGVEMIGDGERVTVVVVGKLYDLGGIVWMAGDGFNSEVKIENGKCVVYTPPLSTTFLKKELVEMTLKEVRFKLRMVPLDIFCLSLAKAGLPWKEQRDALEESFKLMDDEDVDEGDEDVDEGDEDDEGEDAGDEAEADFGNPETTTTTTSEQADS